MNINLKIKDAFDLLQLANKLDTSITLDNESLDQKWYSLVQLHGGVQACVELLRPRKLYINELISFMETIRSISCSISVNQGGNHLIDKPTDLSCTSTQNVQNTNIAISLSHKCAKKPQDEVITKLDVPLRTKRIKIKQIKTAEDLTRNKIFICPKKYPMQRKIRFQKY
jgi:hypothetical protein